MSSPQARAKRLLHWYPASWRERYGDEFEALLIADISEQRHSRRRTVDVALRGLLARLTAAGVAGESEQRARLAAIACVGGVVAVLSLGLWAQLMIGWQWAPPHDPATGVALAAILAGLVALAFIVVLAATPVLWSALRRRANGVRLPLVALSAGLTVLVLVGIHFAPHWPGAGGHAWNARKLAPGGLAAFAWATTLSLTSYWAHPTKLAAFPAGQLAWMISAPFALTAILGGASTVVRRTHLSARALRYELRLARAAGFAMLTIFGGALCWILTANSAPDRLYATGTIDLAEIAVMALMLSWLMRATERTSQGDGTHTVRRA
jgi:hypothetical protein